jgi:hypothetical protein
MPLECIWPTPAVGRRNGAVVYEDGCGGGVDVEVVIAVAGDGEVPHPACGGLGSPSAEDGYRTACGGAQVGAVPEGGGLDPVAAPPGGGGTQNTWLLVVSMTTVRPSARTWRS